jgi:hypothetical protein
LLCHRHNCGIELRSEFIRREPGFCMLELQNCKILTVLRNP